MRVLVFFFPFVFILRLKGLRKLTASYNVLTRLPESIGECVLLEKIRVVDNQITVMPHSLLQLWKRKGGALEELLVDGNPLVQPSQSTDCA